MKKAELRQILKPLIKECIKEVIFEDGILSSVISEVMIASSAIQIKETPKRVVENRNVDLDKLKDQKNQKLQEQRKQMLDAIGNDSFNGVNVFEGITPTTTPNHPPGGPLAGTDSRDPGVDISNLIGSGVWKKLAGN